MKFKYLALGVLFLALALALAACAGTAGPVPGLKIIPLRLDI